MSSEEKQRPEWVPSDGGTEYTTNVMRGVEGGHDGMPEIEQKTFTTVRSRPRRQRLTVDDYVDGVLNGDRMILARTITLVESNSDNHAELAQEVLQKLLPHTGNSIRVGITGVPGVGKSTFIEAFGCYLIDQGHRVAVLAIDPTSTVTRGSILGDKTRMETLSRKEEAFIRPSPTGGTLGGVTRKSRETMLICEAAGFDVILVETVGVGQSEVMVRSMVDFFLLLMLSGAGDELQGIKKGVIELADALLINKADGDNINRAKLARADYNKALHYLSPATEGWRSRAYTCSAVTGDGIDKVWDVIMEFRQQTTESGVFQSRRQSQMLDWVFTMIEEHLKTRFFKHPSVVQALPGIKKAVVSGDLTATLAVQELLSKYDE